VFYPSSQAVVDPPPELAEFAAAKLQGEALCAALHAAGRLAVLCPRLPRMQTDQTLSFLGEPFADTLSVMLPLIRQMTSANGAGSPHMDL
jgi:hypothetical protein